jgi:hypothetical protein
MLHVSSASSLIGLSLILRAHAMSAYFVCMSVESFEMALQTMRRTAADWTQAVAFWFATGMFGLQAAQFKLATAGTAIVVSGLDFTSVGANVL